ncbi:uncharacterized protein H6S33_011101 [Morchella sextelata]|uniref:uncharacterized protein n=1 Tax=Morchella sextelata TaxID=1174677 RepID=UPI001D0497E5|nr:uncharacterized protein H6S33_011101 [Morchella sextelata]KAH0611836.1 hypothetical protein H6S33_011101 [Morchella sextelata]
MCLVFQSMQIAHLHLCWLRLPLVSVVFLDLVSADPRIPSSGNRATKKVGYIEGMEEPVPTESKERPIHQGPILSEETPGVTPLAREFTPSTAASPNIDERMKTSDG